ncbi:simple sugar transport system permease protein [Anaerobranca californiensis DSM 14826]|jgi:simple sugar transport system permease protein|uniref:Simple sugar transport system permease protein n=1 Tax=Anaerobranca californiensis DSM 14826 TaxID=1120989 RepID=A0A1M6QWF7_9FIRM|nr:ABC transporter permease [Anaerobranca californiensis]SHK24534.1 simple sugar transport system permease protein [Anaerobranca californiensis DSM 14826]
MLHPRFKNTFLDLLKKNAVPIFFSIICILGVMVADTTMTFLIREIILRMARNSFLVISLIIPIMAGLGLNFGIVLGAMAGQVAVIMITHWEIPGFTGFGLSVLLSTPIAILFGYLVGLILNKAKGKEMITGMILGFFANGLYQLVFLVMVGTVIPMSNEVLLLSSGVGLRNSIDLKGIRRALDNPLSISYGMIFIPILTIICIVLLCLLIRFLIKSKLGQDFRSVGSNMHIAAIAGIDVDKTRIKAIIISTILAAWGQLIFLQSIGTLNTFGSHEQVGTFAVASILIGGATVTKATIGHALLGTFLFHTLFIISPLAGQKLLGDPQVGEFFRVFVAYGVIAVALALHAWKGSKKKF